MDDNSKTQVSTLTGVAVAVLALSRFIATTNPDLTLYLKQQLTSAEAIGLSPADLELLRTMITSLSA